MKEETNQPENEQRVETDKRLRYTCTLLGIFLILCVLILAFMHVMDRSTYPSPKDIEAGVFFGFGLLLIALFNLPWTRIRIG